MKVAVIGAGFPGLLVGRALQERGHDVTIFGTTSEAGVLSSAGPRDLWHTPKVAAYLAAGPKQDRYQPRTIRVRWLGRGNATTKAVAQRWPEDVATYHRKARGVVSTSLPCMGVDEYQIVPSGWWRLLEAIDASTLNLVPKHVTRILGAGLLEVDRQTLDVMFDRMVTTLAPNRFGALWPVYADRHWPAPLEVTYVWMSRGPHGEGQLSPDLLHDGLHYNGQPLEDVNGWWHRCSWTEKGWCYETRLVPASIDPMAWALSKGLPAISAKRVATQVHRDLTKTLVYPPLVTPVGRFAEWDGELLVSDVVERLAHYVQSVEEQRHGRQHSTSDFSKGGAE